MKPVILLTTVLIIFFNTARSQEVIIKGTLRCINNGTTSTRGAVNIIIIPSFNPKAAVATTTTPQGFFQVNTGWNAKDLQDKDVSLYIITKCSSCKKVQRVFISEDLDKRNTDPTKMYVTVKGWKILENCKESELPDIMSEQLLDSAHRLPPLDISGNAPGSVAMSPVSFINLFQKLVSIAATGVNSGLFKVINIPAGKIKYGTFLHSSPMTNTDNTGFNFAPSRNLSEAVFWNASAIAFSRKPYNVSLLANFKNNIKLSGYQQITNKLYLGVGGIYTKQDQSRVVLYDQVNDVDLSNTFPIPHPEKLEEFAVFVAPVYQVSNQVSVGVTVKSVWQHFNNPSLLALEQDNGILYDFFDDDSIKKQHIDVDLSLTYKISSSLQAGISVMNVAGTKLYGDMFVPDSANQSYVNQRAYAAGLTYKMGRLNVGVDALFTDKEFYDASLGVNYVPFNNGVIAAGYAFKQQSFSLSFRLKHFRIAYINDNNLVVNEVKVSKNKLFDGKIYSGFIFDF
ncbi:MAG: hypothetical protein ABI416_09000 [Ginsengibacter sp.]